MWQFILQRINLMYSWYPMSLPNVFFVCQNTLLFVVHFKQKVNMIAITVIVDFENNRKYLDDPPVHFV